MFCHALFIGGILENYLKYLAFLNKKFDEFFISQKPYIFCKKGCALCCKNAEFPYSKIEFIYLLSGLKSLDKQTATGILTNIQKLISLKKKNKQPKFLYDCPFLTDNVCSIYPYRGLVCRTFGLLSIGKNGNVKIPFCSSMGLNYSNILDKEKRQLSSELFEKSGYKEKPVGFNIEYDFITNKKFEEKFGFSFGDKKPLIDWFEELSAFDFNK